jgi:hypothetical protein
VKRRLFWAIENKQIGGFVQEKNLIFGQKVVL